MKRVIEEAGLEEAGASKMIFLHLEYLQILIMTSNSFNTEL